MNKSAAAAEAAIADALAGAPAGVRRPPAAPRHLTPAARRWYRAVTASFEVPAHHLHNLAGAALALDRAAECRRLVDAEGVVMLDRFGRPKEHPAAIAERGYLIVHARLLREAGLDLQAVPSPRLPTRWRAP